ncbi:hypothetical protein OJAV_G00047040 [Oryzias javanicus]|uniref:Ubiquitin-like domain-containing protein n=1 Tax=Oryzias javanicus TaxID=123683 RepID=A0A3S2N4R5_ORYJA|nr:hypothetical protein OJAV_G00047040 [Oryzias javanicus]
MVKRRTQKLSLHVFISGFVQRFCPKKAMLVTVFCAPRDRPESTFALEVSPELELRDFVALCELESGIPAGEIQITYVEQPLKDPTRALGNYGVKDGDVVVLRQADRRPPPTQPALSGLPRIDFRSITVPGTSSSTNQRSSIRPPPPQQQQQPPTQPPPPPQQQPQQPRPAQPSTPTGSRGSFPQGLDDPALLQQMLLSNPHELSLLKERNPPLAEALLSGDLERFTKVLLEQQQDRARREQERIRLLTADPFDLEAQAKIEEDIRQHNVEENMTIAMEEAPESFGQVVMLYINCRVNGHPVKAFVDSGAQMTIMSQACAERCNIMRLVDRRWAGIAKGVGTQKIIGRVHLAQVQIEGDFLPCSFSILEDQPMDMLLGLDMLKRHQCSIDLKKNVLVIGTTGTETRFLSEAELPECARLAGPYRKADSTDAFGDCWRGPHQPDTADGQATSTEPPPFPLPRTSDQTSPPAAPPETSCFGQPHHSAPAAMEHAPDLLQPSAPADDAPPHHHHPHPQAGQSDPSALPLPTAASDVVAAELKPEEASAVQPMDVCDCPEAPNRPEDEKGTPDEDRCSSSESVPSLAAALMELHELLVSNSRAQSRDSSMSCSPPPCSLKASPTPENAQPDRCTAATPEEEASDAKADDDPAAAAAASECLEFENNQAEGPTGGGDGSGPAAIPEVREPPEGQHERGVADGQASAPNTQDSPAPDGVSASAPSPSQPARPSSPAPPSPRPFTDHFPAEHIQRIQAAGFSASEAVEALERAHGVVELALLALLARSITVPT